MKKQEPKARNFFPNIYRFITEEWKLILTSFASGLILIAITLQGLSLYQNIKEQKKLEIARENIENELSYWKNTAQQYKDYRDVYFKIATLDYELGNTAEAKTYLKKTLDIDPNFKEARALGLQVGI